MASYDVTPLGAPVNFAPQSVRDEVIQNVATILATPRFTVPYDRNFGVNPDYLDDPMPVSRARSIADIIESIHRHEPRCRVESVVFKGDAAEGILRPIVRVFINE